MGSQVSVITISRQMGSLGQAVAQAVSARLGFRLVGRELINQAAIRAGTPEVALAAIDELGLLGLCPSPQACQAYRQAVQQIMQELAQQGSVVILGRAGQVILATHPQAMHVLVVASQPTRIARLAIAQNITLAAAQAQVEASDRFRHAYLKKYYQARWDDLNHYDLVVNTAHMTADGAAEIVAAAAQCMLPTDEFRPPARIVLPRAPKLT